MPSDRSRETLHRRRELVAAGVATSPRNPPGGRAWPLLLPVVAMTVLDYAENAGIWFMLLNWPDLNAAVADATGLVTGLKRITGFAAFTLPIVLAVIALPGYARRLHARRSGVTPPPAAAPAENAR